MSSAAIAVAAPRLVMDETHTYYYDHKPVPGVTNTLRRVGIIDYSGIPQHVLDRAAERGRYVHQALDYLDRGTLDRASLDAELEPYVKAYEGFCRDSGFVCGLAERARINVERWYAGTFDRVGVIGSDAVILDFKSGMYLEGHQVQLAAYANFFPNPRRYRLIPLQLMANGSYKTHEAKASDFVRHTNIFWSALNCVHFAGEKRRAS